MTGVAMISVSGYAVGFVATSEKETSGGGVIDVAAELAVEVPAGVVPAADELAAGSWRRTWAPNAKRGREADTSARMSIFLRV